MQQTLRKYNQNKTPFNANWFVIAVTTKYVNAYVTTPRIIENGNAGSAISSTLKNAIVNNSPYNSRIPAGPTVRIITNTNTNGTDDAKLAFDTISE